MKVTTVSSSNLRIPLFWLTENRNPLRPGMTLEGDVSLDSRHLWEWLTEPLWSLKGKL